jgi:hypothetical protein
MELICTQWKPVVFSGYHRTLDHNIWYVAVIYAEPATPAAPGGPCWSPLGITGAPVASNSFLPSSSGNQWVQVFHDILQHVEFYDPMYNDIHWKPPVFTGYRLIPSPVMSSGSARSPVDFSGPGWSGDYIVSHWTPVNSRHINWCSVELPPTLIQWSMVWPLRIYGGVH